MEEENKKNEKMPAYIVPGVIVLFALVIWVWIGEPVFYASKHGIVPALERVSNTFNGVISTVGLIAFLVGIFFIIKAVFKK